MQDNLNGRADRDGLWIEPQKRSEAGTSRNPRGMSAPELTQESSAFMRRRMSINGISISRHVRLFFPFESGPETGPAPERKKKSHMALFH